MMGKGVEASALEGLLGAGVVSPKENKALFRPVRVGVSGFDIGSGPLVSVAGAFNAGLRRPLPMATLEVEAFNPVLEI
ncbi:MAG TPA: hypothetical protein VGR43_09570 [Dehalococcoidia bacterium]|nr:hypothetical protein [Dehalococcoidia bacterium]